MGKNKLIVHACVLKFLMKWIMTSFEVERKGENVKTIELTLNQFLYSFNFQLFNMKEHLRSQE